MNCLMSGMVREGPPCVNSKLEALLLALRGYAINEFRCRVSGARCQKVGNTSERPGTEVGSQRSERRVEKADIPGIVLRTLNFEP